MLLGVRLLLVDALELLMFLYVFTSKYNRVVFSLASLNEDDFSRAQ